jgi:hypothetical protein
MVNQILAPYITRLGEMQLVLDIENMLRLNCPDKVSRPLKCTQVMQTRSQNVPISQVTYM